MASDDVHAALRRYGRVVLYEIVVDRSALGERRWRRRRGAGAGAGGAEAPAPPREPWWHFLVSRANAKLSLSTFVFWAACMAFHSAATHLTLLRGTVVHDMRDVPPLHDLFHDHFPNLQRWRVVPEACYLAPVLFAASLMIYHFDQRSLDCLRTFLWAHGCLMAMRAACFAATLMPDASKMCHESLFTGSCHDLIYSGHVMIMLLSTLFAQHFFALPASVRLLIAADCAVTSLLVIITRNHYSVDVLLALLLTPFVFVAFTRHPALAALGCHCPEKMLAKPTTLSGLLAHDRNPVSTAAAALAAALTPTHAPPAAPAWAAPRVIDRASAPATAGTAGAAGAAGAGAAAALRRLGADGYELPTPADVQRIAEHAHAALRLLSLRPRVTIFRAGQRRPVYRDANGDDDEEVDDEYYDSRSSDGESSDEVFDEGAEGADGAASRSRAGDGLDEEQRSGTRQRVPVVDVDDAVAGEATAGADGTDTDADAGGAEGARRRKKR